MMTAANIHYELADRVQGLAAGGIGAMLLLARRTGLIHDIDSTLHLLKRHLPYHESDHVLNIAFNILAGGRRIELAEALAQPGSTARHRVVGEMLHHLGYSRPANATTWEGKQHPDRDAQSRYINRASGRLIAEGAPVISVGTQKEGRVGRYATAGREWQPAGEPEKVRTPDFPDPRVGKAIPSGISDLGWDLGWVTVGVDPETASLAVAGIRQGWSVMGSQMDPEARRSLIGADGGGSNGSRLRLWEVELPGLADETGLEVTVGHFPPGTSKWDQIEHRLSSHLPMNWRGRPRVSHQVIVALISATKTATGLEVEARRDIGSYPTKVKVSQEQMEQVRLHPHDFPGEWNDTIEPVAARRYRNL